MQLVELEELCIEPINRLQMASAIRKPMVTIYVTID
jgi:hypothetical protein